jgi:hypothetical protein
MDSVQLEHVTASTKAGIKFFIPSEWRPDTAAGTAAANFRIGPDTLSPSPNIGMKRLVHIYTLVRSGEGKIDFAALHAGNVLLSKLHVLLDSTSSSDSESLFYRCGCLCVCRCAKAYRNSS